MLVDWKLPGSQYDLTLYGPDWDTIQDVVIDEKGQGPTCIFTIHLPSFQIGRAHV